ncbi:substrate-binding domain-containing protein [Ideonella alba]|uniref:Substrate-binding domain-containing protein n=1 Tax=Ideonella alba TaxID=2824118 RepID=A0A941BF62_9BURK|nr:substrate-binding domain-containing protein [Ideonella alba]MBQ0929073.1 substrate-binding domain-containing protein [Ideonella alba]
MNTLHRRALLRLSLLAGLALAQVGAWAAEIRVVTSGAFTEAYKQLIPIYEQATGHTVISSFGASIGNAPDSIPSRFARGEVFDLVILSEGGLEALVKAGQVQPGSRVDLARSKIGAAVRKGTPKPDISTVEALKKTLLDAKSVAYSASASGTYLSTELFPKLGVAERLKETGKRILSERVGAVVARGDAELGFQQVSELIYFKELDFIGTLPDEVQQTIFFSVGLVKDSKQAELATHLARFLASAAVAEIVRATGLEPAAVKR